MVNHRLFGDESDLHFWTVASHYLQSFAQARQLSAEGHAQSEGTQPSPQNHLDICNDVLCESSYFQVSKTREEEGVLACCIVFSLFGKQRQQGQTHNQSSQYLRKSPPPQTLSICVKTTQTHTPLTCPLSSIVSITWPWSHSTFHY